MENKEKFFVQRKETPEERIEGRFNEQVERAVSYFRNKPDAFDEAMKRATARLVDAKFVYPEKVWDIHDVEWGVKILDKVNENIASIKKEENLESKPEK